MKRRILLRIFAFVVLIVGGVWEILIATRLLGRREIPWASFENASFIEIRIFETDEPAESENILKGLNQHTWGKRCRITLEQLCNHPIFPKAPDNRSIFENGDRINSSGNTTVGIRLLGYLRPNATGEYQFFLASNGFAEVWLSTDKIWKNANKIAYINPNYSRSTLNRVAFEGMKSQISDSVRLLRGREYYLEVIYVRDTEESNQHLIQVAWKRPNRTIFEIIDRAFFSPYINDADKAKLKVYDDDLPDVLACVQTHRKVEYIMPETLPYLEHTSVERALNFCEYKPSYLLKPANLRDFKRYHGVHRHTRKTSSYPFPEVDGVVRTRKLSKTFIAEYPLDAKEAIMVVSSYFEALKRLYPRKYKLLSIKRVEKKEDPFKGNRYFLELVVKDLFDGTSYILAEYVFQPRGGNLPLCYPKGLQWKRTADVYLILTAKNLGRWVYHFIKNVETIVQETEDEHLHVVIFDFDSPDIDLKRVFQRSTLKNYHFISKPGNYSRTLSFSEAIQSIEDPNAIVVTMDLHLDIGSQLINDVRKHCIKGKTLYAPQIVYLDCDGSSALPKGSWYHYSYGTIATYKQDWENFGGFSKEFMKKVTWGGEDWDIIDSAVKGGLEIERKRAPWVYHYFHSKKGMWQKGNTTAGTAAGRKLPKVKTLDKRLLPYVNAPPQKETSVQKAVASRKEAIPQKGASAKEVHLQKKARLQNEVSALKEDPVQKEARRPQKKDSPRKEVLPRKGLSQEVAPDQKEGSPQKNVYLQKEARPQKGASPKKEVPGQKGVDPQKQARRPQKEVSSRKEVPPQHVSSQKEASPQKEAPLQQKVYPQKEISSQKQVPVHKEIRLQKQART